MTDQTPILSMDPVSLLEKDRELAAKALNRLTLADQTNVVLNAPPERREELILLSEKALELAQSLSAQEMWLTIKVAGEGESLLLVKLASAEQLQFCYDVEWWRKDRWEEAATLRWLRAILACGEGKVFEWWMHSDPDTLVTVVKKWVTVYMRSGDEQVTDAIPWPREEPPFTHDNMYYFQCNDAEVDVILRPMIDVLARHDIARLRHIFDAVIGAVESEQEEAAYEIRERRLAEYGFPSWDEAISVYAVVKQSDWPRLRRQQPSSSTSGEQTPSFALRVVEGGALFIGEVLTGLNDPSIYYGFSLETARLCNKIVIADGHDINPDTIKGAASKVIGYVNIGLELVSGSCLDAGRAAIGEYWAASLFQIGFSAVAEISGRARGAWTRVALAPDAVPDDPEAAIPFERVRAATWKWPKYYIGPYAPDGVLHRDFRLVEDLASVEVALKVVDPSETKNV